MTDGDSGTGHGPDGVPRVRWTSYAQNYEDVVLARVLADVEVGFWIDVGAQDPRMDSVTCAFAERGWRGINIEPVPVWHAVLATARPGDINLAVAAGERDGVLRFFDIAESGLSTQDANLASRHRAAGQAVREIEVPVRTLASVCAAHVRGPVHFLKVDAEGAEAAVLRGMDFAAVRPWVVVVEATLPNSRAPAYADWEPALLAEGYAFAYDDGINRYYLEDAHAALLPRFGPPTVFDGFVRREQVDAVAAIEGRLADVEALSARRARELESHAQRVAAKDEELAQWQARWQAEAETAGRLDAEHARVAAEARRAQDAHEAAIQREAAAVAELDRMHHEAAALQAALVAADGRTKALQVGTAAAEMQAASLQAALDAANMRAASLQSDLDAADALAASLQAALEAADARAASLQVQLAAANARASAADADASATRALLDAASARLAAVEHDVARLSLLVPDLQARLRAASTGHAMAHAELLRHVGLIDALRAEQGVVLASRSWRLTAPLRKANRLLARLRGTPSSPVMAGGMAAPASVATPAAAAPLPLTEDAEQILAQAPVVERGRG